MSGRSTSEFEFDFLSISISYIFISQLEIMTILSVKVEIRKKKLCELLLVGERDKFRCNPVKYTFTYICDRL